MLSASLRKSVTDLTRRRARTVFTVLTLAIAVASISFFAIPTLIDRAMQQEVRAGRLADVTITMRPVELTDSQLADLAALPNVAAVEARSSVDVRVLVGERRAPGRVIGIRDFAQQGVDVARVESGAFPSDGELLADVQDANVGVYDGRAGDSLTVLGEGGERSEFVVSGRGRTLPGGEQVQDENVIVLYGPASTVAELSAEAGFGELALRLDDPNPKAAQETVQAVRGYLETVPGFAGFSNLPEVRTPGDWPAKGDTEAFAKLLGVITVLGPAVGDGPDLQHDEHPRGRADTRDRDHARRRRPPAPGGARLSENDDVVGCGRRAGRDRARDRAVESARPLLRPDLLGGRRRLRCRPGGVAGQRARRSRGAGARRRAGDPAGSSCRPARGARGERLRGRYRARRRPAAATGRLPAADDADRAAQHRAAHSDAASPRRRSSHWRSPTSSPMLALAAAATEATRTSWGDHLEDLQVSTGGRALLDERAEHAIRATPGVAEAEPVLKNAVELAGQEAFVWALEHDPLFRYRLTDGRWFDAGEQDDRARVAVIERNIAQIVGVGLGDQVTLDTAAGDAEFRIVGIVNNQQENGTALYVPLTTARELLGQPTGARAYWIKMESSEPAFVDRTTSLLEDRLATLGYEVTSEITYIAERDEVAANRSLTTSIAVLGFVIVAMSMIGLANAITTNVLERTREIGILRSIGARARHVRRIFTTEGITLAISGWLLGIPLGYAFTRLLVWLVWEVIDVRLPVVFPPWNILTALIGTVALALLVLILPVQRAVRFRPGDALRYA